MLHSCLPEKFNIDYFIYSAVDKLNFTEEQIMKMPLSKIFKYLGFKSHDNWVEAESTAIE